MTRGYFILGGGNIPLPTFSSPLLNTVGSTKDKGGFSLETDLTNFSLEIPSRDKHVSIWSETDAVVDSIATIDSFLGSADYQSKLTALNLRQTCIILNIAQHSSVAIVGDFFCYGLYDSKLRTAYYLFTDDANDLSRVLSQDPMRYLIYRFPLLQGACFIQSEAVCSKWWRWMKTHQSVLHAFNALEHKLHGRP
jgi:hypothetical protein